MASSEKEISWFLQVLTEEEKLDVVIINSGLMIGPLLSKIESYQTSQNSVL